VPLELSAQRGELHLDGTSLRERGTYLGGIGTVCQEVVAVALEVQGGSLELVHPGIALGQPRLEAADLLEAHLPFGPLPVDFVCTQT